MTTTHPIFRLTFRSQLTVAALSRRETIGSILEVSHRTNIGLGITGALLIWQECVVETLEGHEDTVLDLYTTIARDGRHEACTLLHARHADTRLFDKWSIVRPCAWAPSLSADSPRCWPPTHPATPWPSGRADTASTSPPVDTARPGHQGRRSTRPTLPYRIATTDS